MKSHTTSILVVGIALAGVLGWLGLGASKRPSHTPATATGSAMPQSGTVGGKPSMPADHPAAGAKTVEGQVLKVLQVADYTYLRIATRSSGDVWAAVRHADIAAGEHVRVLNAMLMTNFHSNTLNRDFEQIYFGDLSGGMPAGAAPSSQAARPHGSGGGDAADQVEIGKVKPIGGSDGRTVAQIFAERGQLSGKRVRLRGVVVKAIEGVLDHSWLHLRDGSGSAEQGDRDLVVTTHSAAKVGQTVVAEGRVSVDKDFGAGYRYDVLIEDADIKIEQ